MSCTKEFGLYLLNNCTVFVVQSLSHVWLFVTPWTVTHPRLLCPPLSPRVRSNSYSSTWWCYLTISSFAAPFSFCPQSFPASGSFPVSQLFAPDDQSIGASASASALTMNIQYWFPLGLIGLIFLLFTGLSRVFFNTTIQKHQFFDAQPSLWFNSHIHTWLTGKIIALIIQTFVSKVLSLLFNTLSRFVRAFLSRNKHLHDSSVQTASSLISRLLNSFWYFLLCIFYFFSNIFW